MKKSETRLQLRGHKAIKQRWPKCWGFKVHGGMFQEAGIPDRIYCIDGYFIAIEWKTPEDRREPNKLQEHHIWAIGRAKGLAFFCDNVPLAIRKIKKYLRAKAAQE